MEREIILMGDKGKSAPALIHLGREINGSDCSVTRLESNLHLHQDAAVLQRSLADGMAPFSCFDFRFLDRIHLNKLVEMTLVAPTVTVVVELDRPSRRVDDGRVFPVRELYEKPRRHATEKLCRAILGFSESQSTTSRSDSGLIVDFRLNLYDVRHRVEISFLVDATLKLTRRDRNATNFHV